MTPRLPAGMVLAAVPLVVPLSDPQPEDVSVQQVFDATTAHPDGWVRLTGRITPLLESPTGQDGSFGLLIDAANPLRAIVVEGPDLEAQTSTVVTGRLSARGALVEEVLPMEATVAGTPPRVVPDRVVTLDATPTPPRSVLWPLAIPPLLLAAILAIGARLGYPIFRPTSEIDVLANPLAPGERVPSAYGGRIGPNHADLADPAGALLLIRRGPRGNLLTAQPLGDGSSPAPAPVTIGGSWTSGRSAPGTRCVRRSPRSRCARSWWTPPSCSHGPRSAIASPPSSPSSAEHWRLHGWSWD